MSLYLGIDTSNYTTSAAIYDTLTGEVIQYKKLLPVKEGELGLRQSDAVFHHTVQLPEIIRQLMENENEQLSAIGVSVAPRDVAGSYMPCFLVGKGAAECLASTVKKPLFTFSHQSGHLAAALFSAGRLDLIDESFLAFHVSGGTTDLLSVSPDSDRIFNVEQLGSSSDLKAGQAVDRVGVMLGFPFPAGKYVDAEACKSTKKYKVRITVRDGNCSLSGIQNKCSAMYENGESKENICRYCIDSVMSALTQMADWALEKCGDLPIVFSGGVMSNSIIRAELTARYGAFFAEPEFSCDNAAGLAVMASIQAERHEKA